MEDRGVFCGFWYNRVFIFIRFMVALAAVCLLELYVIKFQFAAPFSIFLLFAGVTTLVFIVVMMDVLGREPQSGDLVMMRLLKRYRSGGVVFKEDETAVCHYQSVGYMRSGFTTETPSREPVSTASFTPEGLEFFRQIKLEIQPGVWPSFKRFFAGLANG